ncbi:MAG: NADPH:quinone reductase, partial [Microbacterium sp.]|nr:NADPH:quinone reductase [Microbacterium sp.]
MRAVIHHEFGEPADVLGVEEVETPTPGPGEVRLRV